MLRQLTSSVKIHSIQSGSRRYSSSRGRPLKSTRLIASGTSDSSGTSVNVGLAHSPISGRWIWVGPCLEIDRLVRRCLPNWSKKSDTFLVHFTDSRPSLRWSKRSNRRGVATRTNPSGLADSVVHPRRAFAASTRPRGSHRASQRGSTHTRRCRPPRRFRDRRR